MSRSIEPNFLTTEKLSGFLNDWENAVSPMTSWLTALQKADTSSGNNNQCLIHELLDLANKQNAQGNTKDAAKTNKRIAKALRENTSKHEVAHHVRSDAAQTAYGHLKNIIKCFTPLIGIEAVEKCVRGVKSEQDPTSRSSRNDSTSLSSLIRDYDGPPFSPLTSAEPEEPRYPARIESAKAEAATSEEHPVKRPRVRNQSAKRRLSTEASTIPRPSKRPNSSLSTSQVILKKALITQSIPAPSHGPQSHANPQPADDGAIPSTTQSIYIDGFETEEARIYNPHMLIPKAGHSYAIFWGKHADRYKRGNQGWYPGVCLLNIGPVFLSANSSPCIAAGSRLWREVPTCYDYDDKTKKIRGWKPGYEDGGDRINERQYPFLYFHGSTSSDCKTEWISVENIIPLQEDKVECKTYLQTLLVYPECL